MLTVEVKINKNALIKDLDFNCLATGSWLKIKAKWKSLRMYLHLISEEIGNIAINPNWTFLEFYKIAVDRYNLKQQ